MNFIANVEDGKIFMIISGAIGELLVPTIHEDPKIHSIYVFCQNESKHKQWAQAWPKIRGVFTTILPICEVLKQTAQECDQTYIPIGLVSKNTESLRQNQDQINQTYMYTQILKEIILTIEFDQQSIHEFINYCLIQFANNPIELEKITKLEREYHQHQPIWWYTYDCFLHSMLNRALRTMDFDVILKMGFFIRDLHEDIVKLYAQQLSSYRKSGTFTVYRGQSLTRDYFNHILKTEGGLLSFNNFLSTSKSLNVSLNFARRALSNPDSIGILFIMTVDPLIGSTRFASIKNISYYQTEREILFSMHSVFRIGNIKPIENGNDRLWQVELNLMSDDDPQRRELTDQMRKETVGLNGWHRLGQFLLLMGQFLKAENLYKALLEHTNDKSEQAYYNHHLGVIKDHEGEYEMAIYHYEKSLEINREILCQDHHYLASSYNGLGMVYMKKGDYPKALLSLIKAIEIFKKTLCSNNQRIAISYGNIGKVYDGMGEYSRSLWYHEHALRIFKETLPEIHPSIATSYFDIGKVYEKMGELSQALSSYERTLKIREKIFPSGHHLLAATYYSIGELYVKMGDECKGLPLIETAVNIGKRSLPSTHPDLVLYENCLQQLKQKL